MIAIFNSTVPIFLLMLIGAIIKRYWLTAEEFWRGMEKLSYFLLFPCAIFSYIIAVDLKDNQITEVVSLLILATCIVGSFLIIYQKQYGIKPKVFTSVFQGGVRYNNYIFFGIGEALYQAPGLSLIAIVAVYMIVFTNVISILVFNIFLERSQGSDYFNKLFNLIKKFTLNPIIFASILALVFNKFEIQIGVSLNNLLQNLSNAALPMGLITVGSALKLSINDSDQLKLIFVTIGAKLIMMPVTTYILLELFQIDGIIAEIGLLYSCLPCASTSYILSKQLGGDADLMASIITFTTIFSILSLSFLMYVLS
jgi:predicted permease